MDKLLKLYQFTMDPDSKVILFKIMHISIVVHYPEPIGFDDVLSCSNGETLDESIDLFKQNISNDVQLWHKHLRNMLSIIEREIADSRKRCVRLNPTPVICPIFIRMAAKLSSVVCIQFISIFFLAKLNLCLCISIKSSLFREIKVFWKDDVWNSNGCDEQLQKRRRHTMMLEKLMEFVEYERGKFCWRW